MANFRPLNPDITELDSVIEKVALLWERPHDPRTKHYLEAQLAELITSFYVDRHGCPSLPDDLNDYSREFANMVNYLTALGFLTGKNPYYGALVDHQTLLPLVDSLPVELKAEGALDWMSFVKQAPHGGKIYLSACAQAQEAALRHVAQEQGLRAFRIAYDRVISQVDELSLKPRAALLLELHRKLASWRNVRKALGKARGKLLLSRTCL